MFNTLRRVLGTAALLACTTLPAQALLVSHDSRLGASSLIEDTNTGLLWLRLDYTFNIGYVDLKSQLSTGGLFDGFAIAGLDDVTSLLTGHGAVYGDLAPYLPPPTPEQVANGNSLLNMFDPTLAGSGRTGIDANVAESMYGCDHPDSACYGLVPRYVQAYTTSSGYLGYRDDGYSFSTGDASPWRGTWLVVDNPSAVSPAPEPSVVALMGLGLLGVAGLARRRAARASQD